MEKNKKYLCVCGETDETKFYGASKSQCKQCALDKANNRYRTMSATDKKNYIEKSKKWASDNMIRVRVLGAKHRAIRKKLDFDIDDNFIIELLEKQNFRCRYSGELLDIKKMGSDDNFINKNSLSIDRIDSTKGYTKDNIVLVTSFVNSIKSDFSENNFLGLITKIYEFNRFNILVENSKKKIF